MSTYICGRCSSPCPGDAFIEDTPYCHGDPLEIEDGRLVNRPPTCYESASWEQTKDAVQSLQSLRWLPTASEKWEPSA